jgi:translation initiation factor 2B subunit (eIF-2B alpha/beta/delta family)
VYPAVKEAALEAIEGLVAAVQDAPSEVAAHSLEFIHSRETVMTAGFSPLVEQFLLFAAKTRDFDVLVAEAAPSCTGHVMARRLADQGIRVTLVPDAAVFAFMSRVNKVILEPLGVTINGGAVVDAGGASIALAAEAHSVPIVCPTHEFCLSPVLTHDAHANLNTFAPPSAISDVPFAMGRIGEITATSAAEWLSAAIRDRDEEPLIPPPSPEGVSSRRSIGGLHIDTGSQDAPVADYRGPDLHFDAPLLSFIVPDRIASFVLSTGGFTPEYMNRLVSESAHPVDYKIDSQI